jgi:membrane associated rhomboid family serine protease
MEEFALETRPSIQPRLVPALGNYVIILAVTCAFAIQMFFDPGAHYLDGMVLKKFSAAGLFGHMWLHMTAVHLVGNLVTLWVFGRYVCPKLGDLTYAVAYVVSGLGAAMVHLAYDGRPAIGASGAIVGILGIYVVLCFDQFGKLGPWLILVWFLATLGAAVVRGAPETQVAHIGGFLTGMGQGVCVLVYRAVAAGQRASAPAVPPVPSPVKP